MATLSVVFYACVPAISTLDGWCAVAMPWHAAHLLNGLKMPLVGAVGVFLELNGMARRYMLTWHEWSENS